MNKPKTTMYKYSPKSLRVNNTVETKYNTEVNSTPVAPNYYSNRTYQNS